MAHSRPLNLFILALCLVSCVCAHGNVSEENATNAAGEPQESTTKTLANSDLYFTKAQSESHMYDFIGGGSRNKMKKSSSLKGGNISLILTNPKGEKVCLNSGYGEQDMEFKKDQKKYSDSQQNSLEFTHNHLKPSNGVCPPLIVKTLPAGELTERDIDGSKNWNKILLVSLPKKLYWPNNDYVFSLISFSGGSGAHQPNGFSGKWGEMFQNVKWRRNTENPFSAQEVEIPTYRNYNIVSDEEIVISVDSTALSVDCQGTLNGSFTIRAENASQIVKTSTVVNSVIAGMTAVTVFGAGGVGSILEIQALSLLSRMNCAPKGKRYGFNSLPYFTSIFVHFGSLWIVLGNALICVIFGSIHYGVTVLYKRMRGCDSSTACARMCFPSLTYFVAYIMHVGIIVNSVSLRFFLMSEWQHLVVGTFGTSYGLIFPFVVLYSLTEEIQIQFVPYPHFINQSYLKRLMSPVGYWTPRNQVKMYGSIFFTLKDGHLYWSVFHLSLICIAGIVTFIPISTENCHIQYFCLMGIFLFGSIVTAVKNMMRSVFLTSMHTLSFLLLAIVCCFGGLNSVSPNKLFFNAYFLITVMLLVVVFFISIYNAIIVIYDWMYVKMVQLIELQ